MTSKDTMYFNRELSWIEFNARVLGEALQNDVPLLERLLFLTIVASNFDEFFMVRVAGLKAQCARNPQWKDVSNISVKDQLAQISKRVHDIVDLQYSCLQNDIFPGLAKEGVTYVSPVDYTPEHIRYLDAFFMSDVFPLLTPLRTNTGGIFPSIGNLRQHAAFLLRSSISMPSGPLAKFLESTGVLTEPCADNIKQSESSSSSGQVKDCESPPLAIVQIPASISRIVWLPEVKGVRFFALLDDVVRTFGQRLFPGFIIEESILFKVTRDADRAVDEERDEDFIQAIQEVLVSRLSSVPVRLQYTGKSSAILEFLQKGMNLEDDDMYPVSGPIDLPTLVELVSVEGLEHLRNPVWKNFLPSDLPEGVPFWDELKRRDILLHVPYQSYEPVIRFINDAADDQSVLAIKMTLYRTSGNSPIIRALERAAHSGKHVTVFVELKARFDEARNISWAHRLEESGIIVVYGLARLKVHAKVLLVVRKETEGIKRYVHLSTGNYNDRTARFYVDMSIFTSNNEIANDATLFFNMISGYSAVLKTKRLVMAPIDMKDKLLSLINREIGHSLPEKPGKIVVKVNSLADNEIIEALYKASRSGVKIMLNVRGVCMLVPGVPGMSENITVVSVIDRFLEHTRIFWFNNNGADELYLGSADWMSRNLDRRVELLFPVLQDDLRRTVTDILHLYFSDNTKSHYLQADGSWVRRTPIAGEKKIRIQELLYSAEKRKAELYEKETPHEFIVRRS